MEVIYSLIPPYCYCIAISTTSVSLRLLVYLFVQPMGDGWGLLFMQRRLLMLAAHLIYKLKVKLKLKLTG